MTTDPNEPLRRLRVVVADDNADLLRVLGDVIDAEPGFECAACVETAGEVLATVRATAADAVLLDVRLRGGSGFDVLDDLHRELPHVRVIVLSGYAQPELEAEALRRGADSYVVKSGDLDELLVRVRRVRDSSAAARPP